MSESDKHEAPTAKLDDQSEGAPASGSSLAETTRKLKDQLTTDDPLAMSQLETFQALFAEYERAIQRSTQTHDALLHQVNKMKEEIELKNRLLARQERLAALGEVAAGVAHEIRNPLGGISLYLEMLASDVADQPGPVSLCKKIGTALKRLNHTVEMILGFTRPIEAKPRVLSANELLEEVVELASPILKEAGVEVQCQIEPSCERLWGDSQLLVQLLLNLVRNAAQASKQSGAVQISVCGGEHDGQPRTLIEVRDHGDGIPAEVLQSLFTPFQTTKKGGTGLGLALCQRIAEAHGAEISGRNFDGIDGDGGDERGACFTLKLPVAVE